VTAEPVLIRAALNRAARRALDRVDAERVEALLALLDRALGEHAHKANLDVPEVAEVLGVSRAAAYELVRTNAVPSIRAGRRIVIPVPALAALLLGCQPDATRTGPTEPVLVNPTTDATSSDRGERT
jgi:excisionase family DNA binding protein